MNNISHIKFVCILEDVMRLKPFVPTDETRFYLNGVRFEQGPEGVLLIATDGHRIGVFNANNAICAGSGIIKLPTRLPKMVKGKTAWLVVGEFGGTDIAMIVAFHSKVGAHEIAENACLRNALALFPCPLIDGDYPNWRSIVPKAIGKIGAFFNSAYLADYAKAANSKKMAPITIHGENPTDPHIVTIAGESNFFGVIMPMRCQDIPSIPSWLDLPK